MVNHFSILLLILAFNAKGQAQTTHQIRGLDFYYLPDTIHMQPGDSIKFVANGGLHNMTETNYANWLTSQAFTNGGFDTEIGADTTFVVDTVGTYYFVCLPHGYAGMKGVLIVDVVNSIVQNNRPYNFIQAYPNPTSGKASLSCQIPIQNVVVLDIWGKVLKEQHSSDLNFSDLKSGTYLLRILAGDRTYTRRIVKAQ